MTSDVTGSMRTDSLPEDAKMSASPQGPPAKGRLLSLGALLAPVLVVAGLAVATTGAGASVPASSAAACVPRVTTPVEGVPLSTEQWANAATIVDVGVASKGLPVRAATIAVTAAMQESTLHDYGRLGEYDDEDALGLFQRSAADGWGTPEQILDPVHSAGRFYDELTAVDGWETMSPAAVAKTVRIPSYPAAHAAWEPLVTTLVAALTTGCSVSDAAATASGWTDPAPSAPLCSGYRTLERPGHDGVDLCGERGTPIRAAAAGIVIAMMCNASKSNGAPYSCDVDGSPSILGCGWYVDILHADAAVTRYCHMSREPDVSVGRVVTVGEQLGFLGSSGNSSAPHLHFETHTAYPADSPNATEPTAFLDARGVEGLG
ncbi:M23 family metallopeptidase [Phytomonospora sp. NPDC050363]|uniref:M23 family metallopeptidase n=1 Tax=Phytomonospora sp. NPDC050363 TaxID=3155642 RepID=UPI0033C19058